MSLILDALNRSRSEVDDVPSLDTQHLLPEADGNVFRRYLPWIALLLAILLIVWLVMDRSESQEDEAAQRASAVADVSAPKTSKEPELQNPAAGKPAAKRVAAPASPKKTAKIAGAAKPARPVKSAKPSTATRAKQNAKENAPKDAQENAEIAKLYATPQTENKSKASPKAKATKKPAKRPVAAGKKKAIAPVDVEKMLQQAQNEMKNTKLVEHPALFIASLSQSKKDAIPTLFYERHDYSSKARQSKVVINGKSLRVGGSAAAGVKVVEILEDSVVLKHQGTSFRLRALNSWINL